MGKDPSEVSGTLSQWKEKKSGRGSWERDESQAQPISVEPGVLSGGRETTGV